MEYICSKFHFIFQSYIAFFFQNYLSVNNMYFHNGDITNFSTICVCVCVCARARDKQKYRPQD